MESEIIIVSGLPRSGTSLMMQMLYHGGLEVVTDGLRMADDDNPAGYYEFEPVKKLKQDAAWLAAARGKAVKVISQLLFDLPATERYAVIFMQREFKEVLASQDKMLTRLARKSAPHEAMRSAFENHRAKLDAWLGEQSHIRVLYVDYADLISYPKEHIARVSEFLGVALSLDAMMAVVDPKLYRNRSR